MNNSLHLKNILKKFEKSLGPNPKSLKEIMIEEKKRRMQHPGLAIILDMYLHIITLSYFLEGAKRMSDPKDLARISSSVLSLYDTSGLAAHNPLLSISSEINPPQILDKESYEKYVEQIGLEPMWSKREKREINKDLKENTPGVTINNIKNLEKDVKILEAKRMGILATATLLGKMSRNTPNEMKKISDLKLRLARFWSGFNKDFQKIITSDALGDMSLAVNETMKNINSKTDFQLSNLPKFLYMRYKNYKTGRNGSKLKKDNMFLRKMTEEEEDNLSGDDIDPILEELHIAMNKLSLIERNALSKSFDGKKLTVAERQAKSRAKKHLAEILKK